jgi:large subunit ribosomal protein L47
MTSAASSLSVGGIAGPSRLNDGRHLLRTCEQRRSIFFSSPLLLQSISKNNGGLDTTNQDDNDVNNSNSSSSSSNNNINKKAIIDKWMRWNTASTFRYTPNSTLLSQISPDGITSTSPLNEFRDLVPKSKREAEPVGRSWSVKELRRKSYDDLHKLWYVLYKERNMLLTETNLARRHGYEMVQPERKRKVQKSMGAIKHVLGERKLKKIREYREYLKDVERLKNNELMVKKDNQMRMMTAAAATTTTTSMKEDGMEGDAEKLSLNEKA